VNLLLVLATAPLSKAQGVKEEPAKPTVAADEPSITFSKLNFTRGRVTKGEIVIINDYFLPKQGPNNWTHKVSMYIYPKLNDPQLYVKNMTANLAKDGITVEPIVVENPKIAGLTFLEKTEHMIKFNVFIYHATKSGKILVGRHFTLRAKPTKEKPFRTLVAMQKAAWSKELINVKFPQFKFPPSEPKAPVAAPKLPALKFMQETVDDARKAGHMIKVDQEFALQQGSEKKIKAPFSIALPQTENVLTLANPKIPETLRLTLMGKDKKYLESIRFTGITIGTEDPMDVRLKKTCALLAGHMAPSFFKSYDNGRIVGNYKTKIGPHHASVTIARMTHKDGRDFYVKFVGLLQEGKVDGFAAVLMINGSAFEKAELKKRLDNGFAQQVLHSIRFAQ